MRLSTLLTRNKHGVKV